MRKLIVLTMAASAAAVLVVGANVAIADPNLPNVAAHRHFVQTPSGKLVEIGPRLCDHPSLQNAFNQFHFNIHISASAPGSPVNTLGPQHGAPGLHNTQAADLTIRGC